MPNYPNLFSPIKIANHTYRNRILAAPMLATYRAMLQGTVSEGVLGVFEDRARGGAAEVVIGETPVNGTDAPPDGMLTEKDVDFTKMSGGTFDAYRRYADVIKKHGAVALIQLQHAGNARHPYPVGKPNPWGPMAYVREDGVTVEAFDAQKMKKVREDYAACSQYMQAAGFDGVLIHGAHGFLFTQFLSPAINRRTDEYGGSSLENRGRFPREIIAEMRKAVGPDFVIELRINGSDRVEGGSTPEQVGDFCSTLNGLADIIHISTGFKNVYATQTFSSMYFPHGLNVEHAAIVKKRTSIPVAVVGGINNADYAESIIAGGKVDFVALARQMYADPEFANKAKSGRAAEIRQCLRCYHCLSGPPRLSRDEGPKPASSAPPAAPRRGENLTCTVNPELSPLEFEKMPKPQGSRKVLVVGGGPAGMQASITAADRGHKVTLVEKDSSLGGVPKFTDTDVHKGDLKNFRDLLVREVNRRGIQVMLNTEATPALLAKLAPEAVILAIGASPTVPSIPGINTAIHVLEVYKKGNKIGKRVVMVGGGLAGCETALQLADTGHEVTLIEMQKELAPDATGQSRNSTLEEIKKRKNIAVKTGAECVEFTPRGVKVNCTAGEAEVISGDTIVYSLGMSAKRAETESLRAAAGKATVFEVGDCVRGAKVFEAVSEGFMAAMQVI